MTPALTVHSGESWYFLMNSQRCRLAPLLCAEARASVIGVLGLLIFYPRQHLGGRVWYVVALWRPSKTDDCVPITAKRSLIRCSSDKQFANSEYSWPKRYFVCWTLECIFTLPLFECMYIVNSRYVVQHCSLTKPQPGNDLITAVWLVNGGLLNWVILPSFICFPHHALQHISSWCQKSLLKSLFYFNFLSSFYKKKSTLDLTWCTPCILICCSAVMAEQDRLLHANHCEAITYQMFLRYIFFGFRTLGFRTREPIKVNIINKSNHIVANIFLVYNAIRFHT